MTKCKECGKEISTKADACPNCGAKQIRTSGCAKVAATFFGVIIVLFLIGRCNDDSSDTSSPATSTTTSPAAVAQSALPEPVLPAAPEPGSQWSYSHDEDPMSGSTEHLAQVQSTNVVEFHSPYSGLQHATLMVRTHPRHGKEIAMQIERGQFLCRSYEDCTVLVRFDDQKAQKYSGVGPADNSTETVFIRNYSRFVGAMTKAKRVRISTDIYQEGAPAFEFDVSGFDTAKYLPKK